MKSKPLRIEAVWVRSMNQDLQTLIELQRLDTAIAGLEAEVESLPRRIAQVESTLSEHIQSVEASQARLAENQRGRRKREGDIAAHREKISKYKGQVFEVKTNEQYKALLHEIEFHEAEIRKIEDAMLAEMIDSEALEKELREAEKNLAIERARTEKEIAEARERQHRDEAELRTSRAARAEVQGRIALPLYETYERVAKFRNGIGVAEVLNGTCGACHVRLRPQAYAETRLKTQIVICESCGRILYFVSEAAAE
jgi:predicted  nucleic acid-binding Zn-ribbon protein